MNSFFITVISYTDFFVWSMLLSAKPVGLFIFLLEMIIAELRCILVFAPLHLSRVHRSVTRRLQERPFTSQPPWYFRTTTRVTPGLPVHGELRALSQRPQRATTQKILEIVL